MSRDTCQRCVRLRHRHPDHRHPDHRTQRTRRLHRRDRRSADRLV